MSPLFTSAWFCYGPLESLAQVHVSAYIAFLNLQRMAWSVEQVLCPEVSLSVVMWIARKLRSTGCGFAVQHYHHLGLHTTVLRLYRPYSRGNN